VNVILDVNPLGIGFYHRQAQTGVSRVVEQLLTGLEQRTDVNLSVAAPTHLAENMRYVQDRLGGAAPTFVNRSTERQWGRVENALLSPFAVSSLPSKVIREAFYRTKKLLHTDEARLDPTQWAANSIYHSPFYPIPEAVRKNKSVRTVQMIHDLIPIFHPEWFPTGDSTVRDVLETLPPDAHVITASEATKQDFCNYTKADSSRVTPIHLAASPALFHPVTDEGKKQSIRAKYGLGDAPYLLSLATFEPRKNTDHLIRCFVQLVQSGEIPADVKLVLVGTKGWKFDKIMDELSRNQELRSRLVVTGFVPNEELAPLYSGALSFVYPSLFEGFGLPPLEALQCGMPVITSTIPAIEEVVGDAAIKVSPTDVDALCQAMMTVVTSSSTRNSLSAKALERASLFSWDKFITEHVALYKRILS
jgi:glycosyltransferase involved in cell wall biosynthesis